MLNSKDACTVLRRMQEFHTEQEIIHKKFGMNFLENLGRRNVIMSQAQEYFLAETLKKKYPDTFCDGRPGKPDISIPSISTEIECKLTSACRNGSINFQTDYETLRKKKSLDYVYIVSDTHFEKFSFLYFEGLTVDDFRVPSPGARGKSQMIKHIGMKKCKFLVGDYVVINDTEIKKLVVRQKDLASIFSNKTIQTLKRYEAVTQLRETPARLKRKNQLLNMIQKEWVRVMSKNARYEQKLEYWQSSPEKYSFILDKIN